MRRNNKGNNLETAREKEYIHRTLFGNVVVRPNDIGVSAGLSALESEGAFDTI